VSITVAGAPVLGACPPPGVAAGPGAESSEHVQFHTQFQPERVEAVGAVTHAPVQFHTHVQVSGAPDASADAAGVEALLLSAEAAGVVAVSCDTLALGADTLSGETPTLGAVTPLLDTVTPGALTVASSAFSCFFGVVDAAGVDAPSFDAAAVPLVAAALDVFACVTAPSLPGLSTRTDTLTLAGAAWAAPEVAVAVPAAVAPPLSVAVVPPAAVVLAPPLSVALAPPAVVAVAAPAALAPALLTCVTGPVSPALFTRTDTFTLAGCACSAMAAPEAAATAAGSPSAHAAGAVASTTNASSVPSGRTRRSRSWAPAIARSMPPGGARNPCNHRCNHGDTGQKFTQPPRYAPGTVGMCKGGIRRRGRN
jgi:hypothetical protein